MDLIALLDSAYHRPSWHGTNLRGSIRGLSLDAVSWRPAPGAHNIWELAVHCAYWKYVVWRKVAGNVKRGAFPRKGSDWFPRTEGTLEELRADLALLDEMHANLRLAVAALDPAQLNVAPGESSTLSFYIRGAALHDVYHAGQAQWLKQGMGK